jgi:hypothetical protein
MASASGVYLARRCASTRKVEVLIKLGCRVVFREDSSNHYHFLLLSGLKQVSHPNFLCFTQAAYLDQVSQLGDFDAWISLLRAAPGILHKPLDPGGVNNTATIPNSTCEKCCMLSGCFGLSMRHCGSISQVYSNIWRRSTFPVKVWLQLIDCIRMSSADNRITSSETLASTFVGLQDTLLRGHIGGPQGDDFNLKQILDRFAFTMYATSWYTSLICHDPTNQSP